MFEYLKTFRTNNIRVAFTDFIYYGKYNKSKKDNVEDGHIEIKMSIKSKMKTKCSKVDESFTDYLFEPYSKPKKK